MKMRRFITMICAVLAIAGSTRAEDNFSVDNVTLPQNTEAEVVVRFSLDAGSTCSGYSFWLQIPDELEFVLNDAGTRVEYVVGDSYPDTPTITPNLSEGYLKVGCLNANSDPLNKQTGTLVTFKVKVKDGESIAVGNVLNGHLTQGVVSEESGATHSVANADFTITIAEPADTRTILDETSTVAPLAAEGVNVRVLRTIKAGQWNTICLPFAMSEAQAKAAFGDDVELGDFNGYTVSGDGKSISVKFKTATAIEANHPYIIKVSSPITEFTVDGVDIDPEEEPTINLGTNRKPKAIIGTYVANTTIENGCLFLNSGKFYYSVGATKMKGYRAYFNFNDLLPDFEDNYAEARISMDFSDATGITRARNLMNSTGDEYYNLKGLRVENPNKGLYIQSGKKKIIK